ncbi:penicillin-binding protein activator, partial [Oceanospirillaceae bacterium]|nr:penicillin-binding protein activator [Oceanospirillaceae bacterium]
HNRIHVLTSARLKFNLIPTTRLFAIGIDAYRLFPRLEQLQAFNNSRVHGVTGLLQMNSQGRIFTHSSWGQFRAGKVIANPR